MSTPTAPTDPEEASRWGRAAATSREHSETAAEGTDGLDMPEIRMHSQVAAEGPEGSSE